MFGIKSNVNCDVGTIVSGIKTSLFFMIIKLTKHDRNRNYYSVICIYRPVAAASENGLIFPSVRESLRKILTDVFFYCYYYYDVHMRMRMWRVAHA